MSKIPKIKKKLSAFIKGEEGKISKKSVLKLSMVAAASAGIIMNAQDSKAGWSFYPEDDKEYIRHSSHSSHGSY